VQSPHETRHGVGNDDRVDNRDNDGNGLMDVQHAGIKAWF